MPMTGRLGRKIPMYARNGIQTHQGKLEAANFTIPGRDGRRMNADEHFVVSRRGFVERAQLQHVGRPVFAEHDGLHAIVNSIEKD